MRAVVADNPSRAAAGTIARVVRPAPTPNRSPCAKNAQYACTSTRNWTAVLRWDGERCYLLTAHPR